MSVSDTFIKRPVLTTVCTFLILLIGGIAIPLLPVEQLPDLAPPTIQVNSSYTGADAETVETTVTTLLEREINGVEGMDYITSNSGNDGSSRISVVFNTDRDKDIAQVNVQNRVAAAEPLLPEAVKQTGVRVTAASSDTLLVYVLYSESGEYDEKFLTNYVDLFVLDAMKRVRGVGDVTLAGAGKYAMRLWLDPAALASRGLTIQDVSAAIREQNIQIGAGAIGLQPAPAEQTYELTARVQGRLVDGAEFEDLVIKVAEDGTLVRLRDVGRAELGAESYAVSVTAQQKPAVALLVNKIPGSNAVDTADAVRAQMALLEQEFPPGLVADIAFDTTDYIKASLQEVFITLIQAIILVIVILYIFLQDWRTTIIPAIAIPVALIGTMAFALVFGFSINALTLFGCILASGLVVDDAIVIVEAVSAKIDQGMGPQQAAFASMNELSGAVVSTSLVLMAVFIPVAFFPGTTGKIYQQFAMTIAFAVVVSTFNALSFSPSMSAILLRPKQETGGGLGRVFTGFNSGLAWTTARYRELVAFLIEIRWGVMVAFAASLVLTVWMFEAAPTGFVPEEDQGYVLGLIQAPDGVSLNYTEAVAEEAEVILQGEPDIRTTTMLRGFSFDGSSAARALFFASLKNWSERPHRDQSVYAFLRRINSKFRQIQGANVVAFNAPPVAGLGNFGGFEMQLQDRSGGQLSIDEFLANAYEVINQANQDPSLGGSAFTQFTASTPQLQLNVDRDRLKALHVNFSEAMSVLGTYLGSQYVNDFTLGQRSYRVYTQADAEFRSSPDDIAKLYVRSQTGNLVSMGELISLEPITGPSTISHHNLFRSIKLQGQAAQGYSSGQALQGMDQAVEQVSLPSVGRDWIGTAREEITSGGQAVIIFGLAIVIVFLVLAAQYESYIDPTIIMLTVPTAMLGALGFLMLRPQVNLDVYAQVGLVMLIGLASKNTILIVEFANQLRAEGRSLVEAAIQAAEQRFRPILMTAISSLVGFFPLVVAQGAGASSRWSIGTVVFGGLLVATFLSLLVAPVLYVVIKSLASALLAGPPPTAPPPDLPPLPELPESQRIPEHLREQQPLHRIQGDTALDT